MIKGPPSRLPASPSTPVFFQCPVCRGTLMIRNPEKYDGSPGPCTTCHSIIAAPVAVKAS
ncbi:MAG: hypothetical protein P8J87_12925 [Verrucomicrobiales bacterium]|nr:hypothetical protein [Verrucomicrobiales bacterium]